MSKDEWKAEDEEYRQFINDTGTVNLTMPKKIDKINDRFFGARMNATPFNAKIIDHDEKREEREKEAQNVQ